MDMDALKSERPRVEPLFGWCNMRTGETDWRSTPPQDFTDYIPQDGLAQGIYRRYMQLGDTPLEAALKVLKICVGEQP